VTEEQEHLLRQIPLHGDGFFAPIFRQGVPLRVEDAQSLLETMTQQEEQQVNGLAPCSPERARTRAFAYIHGQRTARGGQQAARHGPPHPVIRSFLGVPLLDRERQVRGGLLLGHSEPGRFRREDEALLVGLCAQASIALDNARLYQAVQVHAQELDATFESITDGVALLSETGEILRENRAARLLREQIEGLGAAPSLKENFFSHPVRRALLENTVYAGTASLLIQDQQTRSYTITAAPLRFPPPRHDGARQDVEDTPRRAAAGRPALVVVWHDVTEARSLLIERALRQEIEQRHAFLQRILDELPGGVYLVRGDEARLLLANRAATTFWGATWAPDQPMEAFLAEHQIRISASDGRLLHLDELATVRAVRLGERIAHHQETIRHADGTTLPVLVNAVPLLLDQRTISAFSATPRLGEQPERVALVVHLDVSALKEAERLKDEFLGIAAHELRTPVAILKGYAQTLLRQTARGKGPKLSAWQQEALESIDQATERLTELIEDLLDVTRLQAGRLALSLEPLDLVALCWRVLVRMQMTTQRHTLRLNTSLTHCIVQADSHRLEQVLSNLIGNAIKYSPQGGPICVQVSKLVEEGTALLSVCDQGIGIPEPEQAHLFGRFSRATNAREAGIGGTGLGLYLCRELVEQQGGRIWFTSVEGQGSTFFLTLPLVAIPDEGEQE
jgi:two-component system phosphate regulon sensor histidine kinase PhoR